MPTRRHSASFHAELFFHSHCIESKVRDVKLFVSELERTSLLCLVSANKTFNILIQVVWEVTNEIANGVLILGIYQFDPILQIRPNLLRSSLVS